MQLLGQTFLLVLDNVWFKNSNEWVDLKAILEVCSKSSRVIVTTREDTVSTRVGTMDAYKLKPLSEAYCWKVFVKYAFRDGEENEPPVLVSIGKGIVKKCCGVPLAAKTLGSQLWNADESTWRIIKESKLRKIEQKAGDILPALKVSFDQLPYDLRACFSYLSTMESNDIKRREALEYWMALGLLESTEMNGAIEDSGSRCFDGLVSRSFIEVFHPLAPSAELLINLYGSTSKAELEDDGCNTHLISTLRLDSIDFFRMHNLVHELAIYVAGEGTAFVSCERHDVSTRVEHLVWKEEDLSQKEFPRELLITAKKARSYQFRRTENGYMSKSFLHSLISNFRCLRILSLAKFEFEDLPNSIGDLKHLRYLSLAGNAKLERLPDSISKLVNLQTLDVSDCTQLEFPRNLHRLLSLRRLRFTAKVASFLDTGFHGWTSIQWILIINWTHLTSLSEQIGTLITLRFLGIVKCPNLASLPNSIQHLTALEELTIWENEKLNLNGWEGLHGLRNLRSLDMGQLPLLAHFPDGLHCTGGSLQELVLQDCPNLIALPECLQCCTSLLKLKLFCCTNLSTLPSGIQGLQSMQVLWLIHCPMLSSRCVRETGEDWNLISHIPVIRVL